eukprot:1161469-Pelagomonas_calceolata.AAC.5
MFILSPPHTTKDPPAAARWCGPALDTEHASGALGTAHTHMHTHTHLEQCVGAAQLLAQHGVHALQVSLWEFLGCILQVKVSGQLVQDLPCPRVHDVLWRFAAL